ncbi:MAG: NAD(P)-dependent oxidoreductase [Rubrivivax sp.]|nr:NAD(P)-dependent oxidoreductase [Rubrivivax sp.]
MILVTGAGGVIGSAVLARGRELGLDIRGLVRQCDPEAQSKSIIACDLAHCASLPDAIEGCPDAVIHLAAAVPHSTRYPDTEGTATLTRRIDACVHEAAARWGCHVVYASTCGLYDRLSTVQKVESSDDLIRIESPYFAAKLEGERRFASLPSCTVLRLPAPIGAGIPDSLVVCRFVAQALVGGTLGVWGSGRREQNFVDSSDLADATLAAVRVRWHGTINVAAQQPVTMHELADRVVNVVGRGKVELSGKADPRDLETARYSTERATRVLNWTPRVTLAQSIRSLAEHISVTHPLDASQR